VVAEEEETVLAAEVPEVKEMIFLTHLQEGDLFQHKLTPFLLVVAVVAQEWKVEDLMEALVQL